MSQRNINGLTGNGHFGYQQTKEPVARMRTGHIYRNDSNPNSLARINTCTRKAYQKATVNVPVAVKPFAFAGRIKTLCCNDPVIKEIRCKKHCDEQICYFTISQEICVEIPVHFGAKTCLGETWIECHEVTTDGCDDCDDSDHNNDKCHNCGD